MTELGKASLVHTPVTPFRDEKIDYAVYERLLEFHLANGAEAICAPLHIGESPSLVEGERRELIRFVVKQVGGRVPVIAHISRSGTILVAESARDAEEAGADALVMTTPYYWTPPERNILEHFETAAGAVSIPFYAYNAPAEMMGVKLSSDLIGKLAAGRPNFRGLVDLSLDWEFVIQAISATRPSKPDFEVLAGSESMISTRAVGGNGCYSMLAAIAPRLVLALHRQCVAENYDNQAREMQYRLSELRQILKPIFPVALKAALELMDRPVGDPRTPNLALGKEQKAELRKRLEASGILESEPLGW